MVLCLSCLLVLVFPSWSLGGQWYFRAGAGLERSLSAEFHDLDSGAANPPALFGKGTGSDGRPIGAYGDFGTIPAFEAAVGMQALDWLRTDISLAYRPKVDFSGEANFRNVPGSQPVTGEGEAWTAMVNGFLEIPKLFHLETGIFTPYIGGGVGFSYNHMGRMTYGFPGNANHKISITPPGTRTDFAYTAALGTGILVSKNVILDISYRYSDLGRMETDSGNMAMDTLPAGLEIAGTSARLRTHGPFLGFRYLL
jgi:opacity protein-like surface antigen